MATVSDFEKLEQEIKSKLDSCASLEDLNKACLECLLGKSGPISLLTESLKNLPQEERAIVGKKVNGIKSRLESYAEDIKHRLMEKEDSVQGVDVTAPTELPKVGRLAPDTVLIRSLNDFFIYHGYSVAEGPEIETDEYNFERTNLPKDHPARDLQDTIYIEAPEILLRTHTSNVEARLLSSNKPPLRFVVPGVVYRNEILNPSNHAIFYQYQGVCVDKGISMSNLKATLEEFAKNLFGHNIKTRLRTKYYPEVEPGAGMDIFCAFCDGDGCKVCKGRGWIEILGSGMIHKNILQKCGIDPELWSGFAFGMGLDRMIMTKYGINDIRHLHGGNLVYEDSI